jgi:hypothetical protein
MESRKLQRPNAAVVALFSLLSLLVTTDGPNGGAPGFDIILWAIAGLTFLAWILYMRNSRRVANTFVR